MVINEHVQHTHAKTEHKRHQRSNKFQRAKYTLLWK
jgi:hypothetical protein